MKPDRRALTWALRLGTVAVVVAVAVWGAGQVDFTKVWRTLRQTDPLLMATAVPALLLLNFLLRALRFHALVKVLPLPEGARPFRYLESARSLIASQAANNLVPLRLGELVRTRDLVGHGYALGQVAVMQLTEKVVETVTLVACCLPLVPLGLVRLPSIPLVYLGVGAAVLAALGIGYGVFRKQGGQRRLAELWALDHRSLATAAGWSWAADAAEIALIAVCLHAVGIDPDWRAAIAVLVGINLAITLPSTPAQLGAFEAGGALALALFGVDAERAVAFALLYRVVQWGPATLIGGVLWAMPRNRVAQRIEA